jgi:hypothetical protein
MAKAGKKATTRRRSAVKQKKKASKVSRSTRAPPQADRRVGSLPRAAVARAVPVAAIEVGRVEALKSKAGALTKIQEVLRDRLGESPADDDMINQNIDALATQIDIVEAQIAAAETPTLPPPGEADVAALQAAIRGAEDVIAQNAAVNQLIKAAAALIKTLRN